MSQNTETAVHADSGRIRVIRRGGKWYIESNWHCVKVQVAQAASIAARIERRGGKLHLGLPAARSFDQLVLRALHNGEG